MSTIYTAALIVERDAAQAEARHARYQQQRAETAMRDATSERENAEATGYARGCADGWKARGAAIADEAKHMRADAHGGVRNGTSPGEYETAASWIDWAVKQTRDYEADEASPTLTPSEEASEAAGYESGLRRAAEWHLGIAKRYDGSGDKPRCGVTIAAHEEDAAAILALIPENGTQGRNCAEAAGYVRGLRHATAMLRAFATTHVANEIEHWKAHDGGIPYDWIKGWEAEAECADELAGRIVDMIQTPPAWPNGCKSPVSCARRRSCGYMHCVDEGADVAPAIDTVLKRLHAHTGEQP